MFHASKQLLRSVMAVVLALGLALTAVGGTMAQEERDTTPAEVTIAVPTPSSSAGGDAVAVSAAIIFVVDDEQEGVLISLLLPAVQSAREAA